MEEFDVVGVDTDAVRTVQDEMTGAKKKVKGVAWMLVGQPPLGSPEGRYMGLYVQEKFISHERRAKLGIDPMPGDHIMMIYNRWGDIHTVEVTGKVSQIEVKAAPASRPYGA